MTRRGMRQQSVKKEVKGPLKSKGRRASFAEYYGIRDEKIDALRKDMYRGVRSEIKKPSKEKRFAFVMDMQQAADWITNKRMQGYSRGYYLKSLRDLDKAIKKAGKNKVVVVNTKVGYVVTFGPIKKGWKK